MDENIKGVCIFGYGRSGSTLLCEQLTTALKNKHNVNAVSLFELLSPHVTQTPDYKELVIDNTGILDRPFSNQIGIDRLEHLEEIIDRGVFPVFKIFSNDLTPENRYLTERLIMKNPSIYKISLNRVDAMNQYLSWLISCATGVWHHYEHDKKDEIERLTKKYTPAYHYYKSIAAGILSHNVWHYEVGYRKCQKTVWYDQIFQTDYPELGILSSDLVETQTKMNTNHIEVAKNVMGNFEDVFNMGRRLEVSVEPMLKYFRPDSFK